LTTPLESNTAAPEPALEDYRRLAAEHRPEMRQAELAESLARNSSSSPARRIGHRWLFKRSWNPTGRTLVVTTVRTG
jgi:hypothetical protein